MTRRRRGGKRNAQVNPLVALAQINQALGATEEYRRKRAVILERYARLLPSGRPMLCRPPRVELLAGEVPGAFKIIFDSADNAREAARELSFLGAPPMEPYLCPRSRKGHLHLKTCGSYRFEKDC